ncbi:MAG: hypothetical protein RL380_534, partial [Verrucomicrobiota bacterium]
MKILFDHHQPFQFAHGGFQIQIEQTKVALEKIGVQVEWLRWWDAQQTGDVVHFFGRPSADYLNLAHHKKRKAVMAELLTAQGSRSAGQLARQRTLNQLLRQFAPAKFIAAARWDAYRTADALIALTPVEAHLMQYLFAAPPEKIHVVANGVEPEFFAAPPATRGAWLVCTATITERKRVLELAHAAVRAQTPVWILGQPYGERDAYYQTFRALAEKNPTFLRFTGPVNDRAALATIYRQARGFVLLSAMESLSLTALEAAACACPLLLSDLPWARSAFGDHA